MKIKNKIILFIIILAITVVSFLAGLFFGSEVKSQKSSFSYLKKNVSFYSVKKHKGKEMTNEEKRAVKMFVSDYEECYRNELKWSEQKIMNDVKKEVMEMAKNNERITFKIKDLKSIKNNNDIEYVVKKVIMCQRKAYKHLIKVDKRLFKTALSKIPIDNIISLYHGIR